MKVTRVRLFPTTGNGGLLAYADVILDDAVAISDIRLFRKGDGGLHVIYPVSATSIPDGIRYTVVPIKRSAQQAMDAAIISEWHRLRD